MVERKGHVPMRYRFMLIHHQLDVLNNAEIDRKSILSTGAGGGGDMASFSCASRATFFFIIYLKNGPAIAFIMKAAPPPLTLPFLKTMLHSIASIVNSQSKRRIVVGSFLY